MQSLAKKGRKFFAFVLTLLMLATMIPTVGVSAESTDIQLKMAYQSGNYKMTATPNFLPQVKGLTIERADKKLVYNKVEVGKIGDANSYVEMDNAIWFSSKNNPTKDDVLTFLGEGEKTVAKFKCEVKGLQGLIFTQLKETPPEENPGTDPSQQGGSGESPQLQSERPIKSIKGEKEGFFNYFIAVTPVSETSRIDGVMINKYKLEKTSSKISVFGKRYHIADNKIYLDQNEIKEGKVITFLAGEKVLGKFRVEKDGTFSEVKTQALTDKILHVKLEGYFEPAILTQIKYDAITAATGSATSNKNSDVRVYIAETEKDKKPEKNDWKLIKDSPAIHMEKSIAIIEEAVREKGEDGKETIVYKEIKQEDMGMSPAYHTADSTITLGGNPKKAGEYRIRVKAEDELGRMAESEALPFSIYDVNGTTLKNQLKKVEDAIEKSTNPGVEGNGLIHYYNGKNVWLQSPWRIALFESDKVGKDLMEEKAEVTVPKKLHIWKGSDSSGLYGDLGFPMKRYGKDAGDKEGQFMDPVQNLIIEDGTSLTMSNMKIYSSVNIIVKKGGKLNFDDSSLFGKITVEEGGTFRMNYNEEENKYTQGAQINGQLILKNGAILEDSLIYSNANNLTDDGKARFIEHPVVRVEGKVTVKGKVYIRGDESATGISKKTKETYAGQPALELADNAELNIPKESELGVYGGGYNVTTTNGGDALLMNKGSKITGEGKLIAVAGNGHFKGKGGTGIKGEGSVSVAEAFIQGGYGIDGDKYVGKAYTDGIKFAKRTIGHAKDGLKGAPDPLKNPWWKRGTIPGNTKNQQAQDNCLNFSKTEGANPIDANGFEVQNDTPVVPDKEKIAPPKPKENLVYNGNKQVGVKEGRGYKLIGTAEAENAGSYTVKAELENGFVWEDGSSDAKEIKWSIAKAEQKAPEGLVAEKANKGQADGKIKNTSGKLEYFYEKADGMASTCGNGETAGLKAGKYFVRYKEDENHKAGVLAEITIEEKEVVPAKPELKQRTKAIERSKEGYEVEAYDIFFATDDEPEVSVKPEKAMEVKVTLKKISADKDKLQIFHEKTDGSVEEIKDFTVSGKTVSFKSADFSPYIFANKKVNYSANPSIPSNPQNNSNSQINGQNGGSNGQAIQPANKVNSPKVNPKSKAASPGTATEDMNSFWLMAIVIAALLLTGVRFAEYRKRN